MIRENAILWLLPIISAVPVGQGNELSKNMRPNSRSLTAIYKTAIARSPEAKPRGRGTNCERAIKPANPSKCPADPLRTLTETVKEQNRIKHIAYSISDKSNTKEQELYAIKKGQATFF